ncbi:MAG TPA: DUF2249 domain-containing protein [Rhodocyclaceae bacterium]|nr:DUF2249 domain-containing protein [Rhodocyclaceae bacterium]
MIDGRELQPPEPLELALAALDTLPDGEELELLLYCQPRPLYQILQRNGYGWREETLADGTHSIHIWRRA